MTIKLYAKPGNAHHVANNQWMQKLWEDLGIQPVQPNPEKAPWLWHASLQDGLYRRLFSFWPHLGKAMDDDGQMVQGEQAVRDLLLG